MRKFYTLVVLVLFSFQAFSINIPEYLLENDAAHRYLNDFVYDSNDYTYTKIYDYCDPYPLYNVVDYRKDQPLPAVAKLTSTFDNTGILYVSENEDYTNSTTVAVTGPVDSVCVYNLIPGRTYNWKLEYDNSGEITVFQSGQFKTTGQLRMLKIEGLFNVRDLGGWTGLGGHPLRYGVLFRGSRMTNNGNSSSKLITPAGIQQMLDAGIRADLDLRTSDERQLSSSPLGSTVSYDYENNSYASRISTFANDPASISGIQKIINWLKADKPVYFHCSIGADRTGTIAYLIGALCGMSEDALSKEYELTCFSPDYVITNGKVEDQRRERTYHGRYDNTEESYKFALMVEKIKTFPGETLQRKVYYHLNTGAKPGSGNLGKSISAADLDWLIKYMVDYVMVKNITTTCDATLNREIGDIDTINAVVYPENASNKTLSYRSTDTLIAKVSADGVITTVGRGTASIIVQADDYTKTIKVNVPLVESYVPQPDTIYSDGRVYVPKANAVNLIKNGSFEYGNHLLNWTGANGKAITSAAFDVKRYSNSSDSVYIESKADGDSASIKSLRTMWKIEKGKSYVFGYRVKNSTSKPSAENRNLATSLITLNPELEASGDDFSWDTPSTSSLRTGERSGMVDSLTFAYPTYGSEWTEVRYVFTNTYGSDYIQVWFTHLSQDGNNTCLDNFYLCELTDITGVRSIPVRKPTDGRIYNLAGQEVKNPGKGVYIKDGKKYIVK